MEQENQHKRKTTFADLDEAVILLLNKYGLPKTIEKLHVLGKFAIQDQAAEKSNDVLINYTTALAITTFNLEADQFYTSKEIDYRIARMTCFHLIKKITEYSFTQISKRLKQSRRTVQYQYVRCCKIIKTPLSAREKMIKKNYEHMERKVTLFLSEKD